MTPNKTNGANLGFENQLWAAADKLRGHMDASEYKHVVLGLIFLKYISDAFQAKYDELEAARETEYTDPEDRDEYLAANIFWVPKEARWHVVQMKHKPSPPSETRCCPGSSPANCAWPMWSDFCRRRGYETQRRQGTMAQGKIQVENLCVSAPLR